MSNQESNDKKEIIKKDSNQLSFKWNWRLNRTDVTTGEESNG